MNWTVLFAEQQTLLAQAVLLFTLVLGRVGGLLMTAPMFSSLEIPMQVRALLAVAVSLIVAPLQWSVAPAAPESLVDAALLVAGEMLDWDAPTGGYLLQACFSTGIAAADGIKAWVGR